MGDGEGTGERQEGVAGDVNAQRSRAADRGEVRELSVEELIERARAGKQGAFEELFRRYRPKVGTWAEQQGRGQPGTTRPSDIAQNTAKRAFERFVTFKGTSEGEWTVWLKEILKNCLLESQRAGRTKKRGGHTIPLEDACAELPSPEASASQVMARSEQHQKLLASLYQHLPEEQSQAIWLCHLKGFPVAEVAQKMGKSPNAIGGLLARGMKRLRQVMNEEPSVDQGEPPVSEGAVEALLVYLRRCESGVSVDRAAFLAEHPEGGDELQSMLTWIDQIRALWASSEGTEESH
ncbi:RNA polymerase sigma factor [Chondromyces crocatus]|nr:sigma-70 family RNA polymerase sigma factor [Chondromyces crocatus]